MARRYALCLSFAILIGCIDGCNRRSIVNSHDQNSTTVAVQGVVHLGFVQEQKQPNDLLTADLVYCAKLRDRFSHGDSLDSIKDRTPLVIAAANNYPVSARFLIGHGANVNICDQHMTPLSWAANRGYLEVAKLLLQAGALVRLPNGDGDSLDEAIGMDHVDVARLLIEWKADPKEWCDGRTLLHGAAISGAESAAEFLIELGVNINAVTKFSGGSALFLASMDNHPGMVKLLLRHGANPLLRDNDGCIALHEAQDQTVVDLLIGEGGKSSINTLDDGGRTPLVMACQNGNVEAAKALIERGADVNIADAARRSALHQAALSGDSSLCVLLIEKGAKINAQDEVGLTPLGWAIRSHRTEQIRVLRASGGQ
jgi:ankyrin repeat protein